MWLPRREKSERTVVLVHSPWSIDDIEVAIRDWPGDSLVGNRAHCSNPEVGNAPVLRDTLIGLGDAAFNVIRPPAARVCDVTEDASGSLLDQQGRGDLFFITRALMFLLWFPILLVSVLSPSCLRLVSFLSTLPSG